MWHALKVSELPGFVYDWKKPGMNRAPVFGGAKTIQTTLQRMETPVIYFYADKPLNVDVSVTFFDGFITEWYPQAAQIRSGFALNTNGPPNTGRIKSDIAWKNLEIVPQSKYQSWLQDRLPHDSSGSHYFAARETSSDIVRADFESPTNHTSEFEKFLFYRGTGNFRTPLRVSINNANTLILENSGAQPLAHLFAIDIHNGKGAFGVLDELSAGKAVSWLSLNPTDGDKWNRYPLGQFQTALGTAVQNALVAEGLFADEAKAMVNTWKDSWFTEEGTRVLYILPRAWTDGTLPMTLTPAARDLTRVMVGRAEIITPTVETRLFDLLTKAHAGDTDARLAATADLKKLGRFAEPALTLAAKHSTSREAVTLGYQILYPQPSLFE
jgi:hypothetical protein